MKNVKCKYCESSFETEAETVCPRCKEQISYTYPIPLPQGLVEVDLEDCYLPQEMASHKVFGNSKKKIALDF